MLQSICSEQLLYVQALPEASNPFIPSLAARARCGWPEHFDMPQGLIENM